MVNPGLKTPHRKLNVIYTLYASSTWLYSKEELQVLQERAYSSSGYGAQSQIRASWHIHVPATVHVWSCMFMLFLFTETTDWTEHSWGKVSLLRFSLFSWLIYFQNYKTLGIRQRNGWHVPVLFFVSVCVCVTGLTMPTGEGKWYWHATYTAMKGHCYKQLCIRLHIAKNKNVMGK